MMRGRMTMIRLIWREIYHNEYGQSLWEKVLVKRGWVSYELESATAFSSSPLLLLLLHTLSHAYVFTTQLESL